MTYRSPLWSLHHIGIMLVACEILTGLLTLISLYQAIFFNVMWAAPFIAGIFLMPGRYGRPSLIRILFKKLGLVDCPNCNQSIFDPHRVGEYRSSFSKSLFPQTECANCQYDLTLRADES